MHYFIKRYLRLESNFHFGLNCSWSKINNLLCKSFKLIYIYTFVNHKFTYLQSSDLNLLTYYLCIMFSRSNITLYQFYSPYSVHEWNCQWIVWWCGHVKLETIKTSYTQALVYVWNKRLWSYMYLILCDTVNPYLWNNCDSFKVFEKWGTYLHQMMDISTVNC